MMPPTSIDGTDITGATIDGQDVQEITVDGQTVFTAGPTLPVAYSNLIAWYPFDSAEYGGSNADDVTAILGGSGDDTEYDGTVNGPTHQSSAGLTDINAGANSGAFDFGGSDDVDCGSPLDSTSAFSAMCWAEFDSAPSASDGFLLTTNDDNNGFRISFFSGNTNFILEDSDSVDKVQTSGPPLNQYIHFAVTFDGSTLEGFIDGSSVGTESSGGSGSDPLNFTIGARGSLGIDGRIDDVRLYNTGLSTNQIQQIVQNTQDPNNPVYP